MEHQSLICSLESISKEINATILIVEDDAAAREILTEAFEAVGHSVTSAVDGEEAIRLLEDEQVPNLIILDLMLPGMSGLEICRWARSRYSSARLPIIIETAIADVATRLEALAAGADDYVTKPMEPKEVVARANMQLAIRALLTKSEWRRQSLEVLFRSIPIGLVQQNDHNETTLINPIARNILSIPDDKTDDSLIEERLGFSPKGRCCGNEGPNREDRQYEGGWYRVDCRCIASDGKHMGSLVVLRDVTRERELDQLKSEFAQVVSHELRTPLTAIKNAIDLLRSEDSLPADVMEKLIDIAHRNTDRMGKMVHDLLDISRLEAGRTELTLVEADLCRIIDTVSSSLEQQAKSRNIEIHTQSAENLPSVYVDVPAIERVVANLISNAIKYTRENTKVSISIAMEEMKKANEFGARAELLVSFARGYIRVAVTDQGVGIPETERERIFNKFVRIKRKSYNGATGTGLGLSIAQKLIRAHGGTLSLESKPGEGSTFYFYLPIYDQYGALAISVADRLYEAKRDRRSLGIIVLRVCDGDKGIWKILSEDKSADNESIIDLAEIVRDALFRSNDFAVFIPHLSEIVILLEGCLKELLPQVGARVAKDLRKYLLDYKPDMDLRIISGSAYSPPEGSFDNAVMLLSEARRSTQKSNTIQRPKKILVVDDDPLFLKATEKLLTLSGYEVQCAQDSDEAFTQISNSIPDLVLLDVFMPNSDGYRLCLEIRSCQTLRDLPIFFVSGVDKGDPRAKAFSTGGNEFLKKPINPEELLRLLRLYLG